VRVTQAGMLKPGTVKAGMWVTFALAALIGVYLAWVSGWPVIAIGVAAILAALLYTGGPFPYGYRGLGELFVFLFFGVAAVMGTYYIQAVRFSLKAFIGSVPIGLLIVAILAVKQPARISKPTGPAGKQRWLSGLACRAPARNTCWRYCWLT